MSPEMTDVQAFWDTLLPGGDGWPCASQAIVEPALMETDEAWLRRHAAGFAAMPGSRRVRSIEVLEQLQPERFGRVLAALYEAYYSAAAVQAVVQRLAEAGPREPSDHFDESLLRQVSTTRAAERRL